MLRATLNSKIDDSGSFTPNESSSLEEATDLSQFAFAIHRIIYMEMEDDNDVNFQVQIKVPREEYLKSVQYGNYYNFQRRLYFVIERVKDSVRQKKYELENFDRIWGCNKTDYCLKQLAEGIVSTLENVNVRTVKVRLNLGKLLFRQEDPNRDVRRILNSERDFGKLCKNLQLEDTARGVTTQFCTCISENKFEKLQRFLVNKLGFKLNGYEEVINFYVQLKGDIGGQQYVISFRRNEHPDGFVNYELRKSRLGYRKTWFLTFLQDSDICDGRFKICEDRFLQQEDIPEDIQQFQDIVHECLNQREYKNVLGAVYSSAVGKSGSKVYISTSRKKQKTSFYGQFKGQPVKITLTHMEVNSNQNQQYEAAIWNRNMQEILSSRRLSNNDKLLQIQQRLQCIHDLYQIIANC
eukprot:TRINITY_DN5436_c0_g2_i1.p1 TRINITY_DN5436_c0_g2~~TRINITY_DN5436_c0_g2_i1.p1  ORF type:complete len:409 (-),score=26.62 TRINITY_DN5436_c0_g2_i1:43-1269(-)